MAIDWAQAHAEELLKPLGDRWLHTQGVVGQAECVSRGLSAREADVLKTAAYLHDLGYAPRVSKSGFHPLDAAVYLEGRGVDHRVCCLVAHHSAARFEAAERGLSKELAVYAREDSRVMDALTYADMTTSSAGQKIAFDERMKEILRRYSARDPVGRVINQRARPVLRAAVERTERCLLDATNSADVGS